MGHLYHRHDGSLLAFVPGGRDEDYEHHLRAQGIPFRVVAGFPKCPPIGVHPQTGTHLGVYRTAEVSNDDGSVVRHHFIHRHDGGRLIFKKETLVAAPAAEEMTLESPQAAPDEDITGGPANA